MTLWGLPLSLFRTLMSGRSRSLVILGLIGCLGGAVAGVVWRSARPSQPKALSTPSLGRARRSPEARSEATRPGFDFRRALDELEGVVEAVEEEDWARARQHFASFEHLVRVLPTPGLQHPDVSLALTDFFALYRVRLERALAAGDVEEAIFACNQLGDILWDLRVRLGRTPVPEVGRLRYLGRDLRYWSERGDGKMIRMRILSLEKAWRSVRPIVLDRGEKSVVAELDELLDRLHAAQHVEEVQQIAPELERAIRRIEAHLSDTAASKE